MNAIAAAATSLVMPSLARVKPDCYRVFRALQSGWRAPRNSFVLHDIPGPVPGYRVFEIQDWMNTYPRRILNGSTPLQSFKEAFGLMGLNIKLLEAC